MLQFAEKALRIREAAGCQPRSHVNGFNGQVYWLYFCGQEGRASLRLRAGKLPKLPDMVQPVVSVGLAAVGRGNDLEKTARFMGIV